jgi:hypothetical protein
VSIQKKPRATNLKTKSRSNGETGSNEDVQSKIRIGSSSRLEPHHDRKRSGYARKQSRQHRTAFRRNSASAVDLRPARLLLAAQRFHRAGHRLASADLQSLGGLGTAWLEMAARLAPLVSAPSGPALAQ